MMNLFQNIFNPKPVVKKNFHSSSVTNRARNYAAGKKHFNLKNNIPAKNNVRQIPAAQVSRITNDWVGIYETINQSIFQGLIKLRARSRELALSDPYAKKYLQMLEKNVVGPDGFILRNKAGDFSFDTEKGKYAFKLDKLANQMIQSAFADWSKMQNCTVTGMISFREATAQTLKTMAVDGEVLVKQVLTTDNKFGYTLQIIEADYLDERLNTINPDNGNAIIMGVEINKFRKPVAYWLRKNTNQSIWDNPLNYSASERIPAEQMIHLFVQERPGQLRGVPWFAPSMIRMKMLMGYEEAVLTDARLSADKHVYYQYKDTATGDEINEANIAGSEKSVADPSTLIQSVEPGETAVVPKGMEIANVQTKSPSGRELDFTKNALRGIASGLDVSYIALANNYEAVNYTSSRTNLLEERDTWKTLHSWTREHFFESFYPNWLQTSLLRGAITYKDTGKSLPLAKFDKFNMGWFQARGWQWVSPKDEAEAWIALLSNNIGLLDEILGERGWSLEEFVDELVYEKEVFKDAGLEWPGSGYRPLKAVLPDPQNDSAPQTDNTNNASTTSAAGGNGKAHQKFYEMMENENGN